MNELFFFLASATGRIGRVLAGLVLVVAGLIILQGTAGIVLAAVGLVPIAAGLFDLCLFAPLAGLPVAGSRLRQAR